MKKISILLIFSVVMYSAQGQSMGRSYQTALGFKFYPGALSVKHFVNKSNAIEGLGYFWQYGSRITGLYEIHGNINGAPGLKWYVGPGAHVGFWNNKWKDRYGRRNVSSYFGVDGVLGLDYKINRAPINLSIDWQPSFSFGDDIEGYGFSNWGGFAIRYTF
jgi:hypothetical protein